MADCCNPGSHDNSYASTLHQLENEGLLEKITILRGYKDLARELKNLNLPIAEVEGVFMTQKIPSFYPKKGPAVQTAKLDGLQELPASSPLSSSSPKKKPMDSLKPPKYLDPTIVSELLVSLSEC